MQRVDGMSLNPCSNGMKYAEDCTLGDNIAASLNPCSNGMKYALEIFNPRDIEGSS